MLAYNGILMGLVKIQNVLIIVTVTLVSTGAHAQSVAISVDGGGSPSSNFCRYYDNLRRTSVVFSDGWQRTTLATDGPGGTEPDSVACAADGTTPVFDTDGTPHLIRHPVPGTASAKADGAATKNSVRETILARIQALRDGDSVMLYFTDHGNTGSGPDNRTVMLWGERLSVDELRPLLQLIPERNKLILVNDQCFGGGMLEAIFGKDGRPRGNSCGFAAATAAEMSYDGGGFMKKAERYSSGKEAPPGGKNPGDPFGFQDVHRGLLRSQRTGAKDLTFSLPVSSGDLFLKKYDEKQRAKRPYSALSSSDTQTQILASCSFSEQGFKEVAAGLSGPMATLLQSRIDQLKEDLVADYKSAGIDPATPYSQISEKLDEKERQAKYVEFQEGTDYIRFREAMLGWLRDSGDPELYKSYQRDNHALLNARLDLWAHPAKLSGLADRQAKVAALEKDLETENFAIKKYERSMTSAKGAARLSFDAYTQQHGGDTPSDAYPKNIAELKEKSSTAWGNVSAELVPLRRLQNTVVSTRALGAMMAGQDTQAMTDYLGLLDCENTPIGPLPKAASK